MTPWICLGDPPTRLDHHDQRVAGLSLLRHPFAQTLTDWCRNVRLLSIAYASRPRLRYRLTHGRIILPQETLGLRRPGFSPGLSLLMPAYSLATAESSRHRLPCISVATLAYRSHTRTRGFGTELEPRYIFGAGPLDQ